MKKIRLLFFLAFALCIFGGLLYAMEVVYHGPHPIPQKAGGGYCVKYGWHTHSYLPENNNDYAVDNNVYRYRGQMYIYHGQHPENDGSICTNPKRHTHPYPPQNQSEYEVSYRYRGVIVGYMGPHITPEGNFCEKDGLHYHDYYPGNLADYNNEKGVYRYTKKLYYYAGPHPTPEGGWCTIEAVHPHHYGPPLHDRRYRHEKHYYRYLEHDPRRLNQLPLQKDDVHVTTLYHYIDKHPTPEHGMCNTLGVHTHPYPPPEPNEFEKEGDNYRWRGRGFGRDHRDNRDNRGAPDVTTYRYQGVHPENDGTMCGIKGVHTHTYQPANPLQFIYKNETYHWKGK